MNLILTFMAVIGLSKSFIEPNTPIAILHGINSNASTMEPLRDWIQERYPEKYVKLVEVGSDPKLDSIFMTVQEQVDIVCETLNTDPLLSDGIHLIGYSHGTLLARGYIEKCNTPPVNTFVSIAGPQAGLFGTPYVDIEWIDKLLGTVPYVEEIQRTIAPAQYWKDPFQLDKYKNVSLYLADIDNENKINQTYIDHMTSIDQMILMYSTVDTIIHPKESGWFSFYSPGTMDLIPMQETEGYLQNKIGLRTLNEQGKIQFLTTNCTHTEHFFDHCRPSIEPIMPYLM